MPDVFISYSRKDKPFVQRVHAALAAEGRDVWIDWEDIPLTSDWWGEICAGIESADTFVLIVSPDALSSPMCHMEIDYAARYNKRFVPLVRVPVEEKYIYATVGTRELDDNARKALNNRDIIELARENWNIVARHNWLFFQKEEEFDLNYKQLIKAIDTDLDYVRNHTRLTVRGREWENKTRNESFLLRGDDLLTAEAWLAQAVGKEPSPTSMHAEYIAVSRQAENQRQQQEIERQNRELELQRRATQNLRFLLGGALAFLVIAVILLGLAYYNYQESQRNYAIAQTAQAVAERRADEADAVSLAEEAEIVAGRDPFLAYTLGLHAVSLENPPARAQNILANLAYQTGAVRPLEGHTYAVELVAISTDGTRAVSVDRNTEFVVWDINTGETLRQFSPPDQQESPFAYGVYAWAISPDLRRALLVAYDGTLILYDIDPDSPTMGTVLQSITTFFSDTLTMAISPDGNTALVATSLGALVLLDINPESETVGSVLHSFEGHLGTIVSVGFSSNGRRAFSAANESIIVWEIAEGANQFEAIRTFTEIEDGVTLATFSSDGTLVLSASFNNALTLWNVTFGNEVWTYPSNTTSGVTSLAFSPDGHFALAGDVDGEMTLWNTTLNSPEQGQQLHTFSGHIERINSLMFSPDGHHVLSGSEDSFVLMWDVFSSGELGRMSIGYGGLSSQFSPDGQHVLSVSSDYSVGLWDVNDTSPTFTGALQTLSVRNYDYSIESFAVSPDGWHVLTGGCSNYDTLEGDCVTGSLSLWDIAHPSLVWNVAAHVDAINAVAMSPDGNFALTAACTDHKLLDGTCSSELMLWNLNTTESIRTFSGHENFVKKIVFAPNGIRAASLDWNNDLILWDIESGELLHTFHDPNSLVTVFAFSADSSRLLIGSEDGSLTLHDVSNSDTLGAQLEGLPGHSRGVSAVAFSPDGRYAASGAVDGSLILWDVATRETLRTFPQLETHANALVFSPDGRRLLVSSDSSLTLWHVDNSLDELVNWLYNNRYIDDGLSCSERIQYGIEPPCNEQGIATPRTPYPTLATLTATTIFTASPTVDVTNTTLTPTFTPTVTVTPTSTPFIAGAAFVGEQSGQVPAGGGQSWNLEAQAGETMTIIVTAIEDSRGYAFDTTVTVFAPDGSQIAFNDDNGVDDTLNSLIENLLLPETGTYQIVVGSYGNFDGGYYTLTLIPNGVTPTPTVPHTPMPSPTPYPTGTPSFVGTLAFGEQEGVLIYGASESWNYTAEAGEYITVELVSTDFDTTVTIFDPNGFWIAFNDDNGVDDTLNSLVENVLLPESGTYEIMVSSFGNGGGGDYTLTVSSGVAPTLEASLTPTVTP
jgi:WD40 repeat protein